MQAIFSLDKLLRVIAPQTNKTTNEQRSKRKQANMGQTLISATRTLVITRLAEHRLVAGALEPIRSVHTESQIKLRITYPLSNRSRCNGVAALDIIKTKFSSSPSSNISSDSNFRPISLSNRRWSAKSSLGTLSSTQHWRQFDPAHFTDQLCVIFGWKMLVLDSWSPDGS